MKYYKKISFAFVLTVLLASFIVACGSGGGGVVYEDADGDGFTSDTDCDDNDASINPGMDEVPDDGKDNDCDGLVDSFIYYMDSDGDGYGNPYVAQLFSSQPEGYVTDNTDCDDNDASINPGMDEVPDDGKDNDCDGLVDSFIYYMDSDGDGYGDPDVSQILAFPQEGYVSDNTDCDDDDILVNPEAIEICNGKDNDCDGIVDDDCFNTIYVPYDFRTIQEAIDAALDGYLVLVNKGTYFEKINFKGKAIIVKSINGAADTTINADDVGSVVTFSSGESGSSVLDGFTVTGGSGSIDKIIFGGGIHCSDSSPTITNCIITGNKALNGGGVYGSPNITNCTISDNLGGGVYGSPNITNCTITNNTFTDMRAVAAGFIFPVPHRR